MSKVLSCCDVGTNCGFAAHGETAEEILKVVSEHARKAHGITNPSPAMVAKLRAAIREEGKGSCGPTPSCDCH